MTILVYQFKVATDKREADLLDIKSRIAATLEFYGLQVELVDEYEETEGPPDCEHRLSRPGDDFCVDCGQGLLIVTIDLPAPGKD